MNQSVFASSGWRKVLTTPISQLLRGRITGPLTLLEMLDTSSIPSTVVDALGSIVKPLPRRLCSKATRQLVAACKKQLQAGRTESELIDQLSDAKNITLLIRKTRTANWVLDYRLPTSLWPTVTAIVEQSRRQKVAVLNCICRGLQSQLEAGQAPDDLISRYSDAIAVGKLIQQTKSPELLLADDFPESVVNVVLDVVRRTRLWSLEKSDTAQELFAHFTDGLEQGNSSEDLIASFGCPKTSAKLIRRATIRKRSLAWHTWRRACQTTAALLVVVLVTWTTLAARFMLAEPTITYDLIQQFDDKSRAIPVEQRAWPLYRKGIVMLYRPPPEKSWWGWEGDYRKEQEKIDNGLSDGSESEHWLKAKAYLEKHADVVEIFLKATTRPQLGFINRDPGNKKWLMASGRSDSYDYNPPEEIAFGTLLISSQDLNRYVSSLFNGAIYLAAEQRDGERCLQLLHAKFVLASHIKQAGAFPICQFVSKWQVGHIARLVSKLLKAQPEIFKKQQLEKLAQKISETDLKSCKNTFLDRSMLNDFIQKSYSDDGSGNGRFTPQGFSNLLWPAYFVSVESPNRKLLVDLVVPSEIINPNSMEDTKTVAYRAMVTPLTSVIADRKEMQQKLLYLLQLLEQVSDVDQFEDSAYMTEYRSLYDSAHLRLKYLPALILMPDSVEVFWVRAKIPQVQRDTALITIAAELYRRRHGEFPEVATKLVPEFLSEIPNDPYSNKPLNYSLKEGRPHIDSEGLRLFEEMK